MVGIGRTVFEGDRLDEFKVHILGVLRNVIGTRRNLILARLEGGPLANTGVIAGMSGSPVYIDGRLVGAVSYSLGAVLQGTDRGHHADRRDDRRRHDSRAAPPGGARRAADAAHARRPARVAAAGVLLGHGRSPTAPTTSASSATARVNPGIGTMLRPIATPLTLGGFDASVIDPVAEAFRDQGFVPVMAGALQSPPGLRADGGPAAAGRSDRRRADERRPRARRHRHRHRRRRQRVYAFGHPFYGLGPTQFPMTRAYVHTLLPSLQSSMKIASTGEVIGTVQQDRVTTIAGTLGAGPQLIPIKLTLTSERGTKKTFNMAMVNDQLFTPLLAYLSILNTLTAYERQNGAASYVVRGTAAVKGHGALVVRGSLHGRLAVDGRGGVRRRRRSTSSCATRSRTSSSKG